jgi:hypothetical protein
MDGSGWLWSLLTIVGVVLLAVAFWYGTRRSGGNEWRRPMDSAHAGAKPESAESAHYNERVK